jgi:hypothetical protein
LRRDYRLMTIKYSTCQQHFQKTVIPATDSAQQPSLIPKNFCKSYGNFRVGRRRPMHRRDASDPVRIWRPATEYGESCQVPAFPTGIRHFLGRIGRFLLESSRFLSGSGVSAAVFVISCQDLPEPPVLLTFSIRIRRTHREFSHFLPGFGKTTRGSIVSRQDLPTPPALLPFSIRIRRNRHGFSGFLLGFGKNSGASLISYQDLADRPGFLPFPTGIRQNRWRCRRFPERFGGTTRTSVISCQDSANTAGLRNEPHGLSEGQTYQRLFFRDEARRGMMEALLAANSIWQRSFP